MTTNQYIIDFYNNYDEDSRLSMKHGAVEFLTTMRYIEAYITPGSRVLEIGEPAVRVTQIGKEGDSDCVIRRITGQCVMPTEGIFAEVVREGRIYPGDAIVIKKECGDEVH